MGLLRTPPQKVNPSARTPKSQPRPASPGPSRSPIPHAHPQPQEPSEPQPAAAPLAFDNAEAGPSEDVGNTTTVSVTSSHAFVPRKPNVVRSPPAGSSIYPSLPAATPIKGPSAHTDGAEGDDAEMSMEIDGSSASTQRASTPTRQPAVGSTTTPSSRPIRPARAVPTPSVLASSARAPTASTPAPSSRTQATTPGPSRGTARSNTEHADADVSVISDAANNSMQDTTMPSIPPPPDSPPRQTTHDTGAFVTPKPSRASKTPGTKRKAPADEPESPSQDESTVLAHSQVPAEASGAAKPKADYGRRWKMSNDTLKLVTERVVNKWTAEHLKKSLPTLAEQDPRGIESIHRAAAHNLQANIMSKAQTLFEHYRMGRSLQSIDRVVLEGDEYEKTRTSDDARPDAWRSDLSPEALTAAMNLQMYDEGWARLRTEYIELHEDSRRRYASILAKQAQLKELEGAVSDGVVELEKTIKLLDGFPSEDMMAWMEDTVGRVGGARDA